MRKEAVQDVWDVRKTERMFKMKLRKLSQEEHQKTRVLWEKIFIEDTNAFLDYYYTVKTRDNEIFVVEDQGEIIAMLQLNPYQLRVNQNSYPADYIVAVATDERYRKRGIMASLLKAAIKEMYSQGKPFTFLMPAAESIYYPFDFRFVYRQGQSTVCGKKGESLGLEIVHARPEDCEEIAAFANCFLKEYQVVAKRDANYYKTLLEEQKSEAGGVVIVKKQERLAGVFCYAKEAHYEIREPLFVENSDFEQAVYELTKNERESVKCLAYGSEKMVPIIMARVLHLETFLKSFSLKEEIDFCVKIQDDLLEENNGIFHIAGNQKQGITVVEKQENSTGSCGEITIGALTSILFGYLPMEEFEITDELKGNFRKVAALSKVFLNEIV